MKHLRKDRRVDAKSADGSRPQPRTAAPVATSRNPATARPRPGKPPGASLAASAGGTAPRTARGGRAGPPADAARAAPRAAAPLQVSFADIDAESAGQRIDNWLLRRLKGVPKSHVYRILSSGEVRVNSGRVDASYRLEPGDRIRIPPVRRDAAAPRAGPASRFTGSIVYEDDDLIVVDKPAGDAVHGGSGVSLGIIEQLRAARPEARYLELVHRLDRDTSGLLMVAKRRAALVGLHEALRSGTVEKRYLVLVLGKWQGKRDVRLGLRKYHTAEGERRVVVDPDGQDSRTVFRLVRPYGDLSLLEAEIHTGRTHQIRVQLAHLGYPVAGDDKYGDFAHNKELARIGLKRMFLHAAKLGFVHPVRGDPMRFEAPLPARLEEFLGGLEAAAA
jgi:23S rRNA pseudouridine955/2504/2580 synthase